MVPFLAVHYKDDNTGRTSNLKNHGLFFVTAEPFLCHVFFLARLQNPPFCEKKTQVFAPLVRVPRWR